VLKAKLANVKVGLGEEHDPRLPARSLDTAVLIHMYHEIAQPYALLFNLAGAMKPQSLVAIVDLDLPPPPISKIGLKSSKEITARSSQPPRTHNAPAITCTNFSRNLMVDRTDAAGD
jgi:hypothetical protein